MNLALLGISAVALVTAAWLKAAGTAITRIPRADAFRDAGDGRRGAGEVADLLEKREAIAPAVGMVSTGLILVSAVVGAAALGIESNLVLIYLLLGLAIFVLGDILPREIGRRSPHPIAYAFPWTLRIAIRLGGWAAELLPEQSDEQDDVVTGILPDADDGQEREMIDSVLEFGETVVREIMTPRPDMVTVPLTASIEDLVTTATEQGFSRVPVTSNGDIVGLVIVKDLLPALSEGQRPSVAEMMRPVEFVPESKLASALLGEMKESHIHQMIVVDEYGDVAGLVTIEDLLEELVGEISDETDEDEVFIEPAGEGRWVVDARLPVDDLAEVAGVELPDGDWDTVGGLVLDLAERVPEVGETFAHGPVTFLVTRMQGRRISEIRASLEDPVEAG